MLCVALAATMGAEVLRIAHPGLLPLIPEWQPQYRYSQMSIARVVSHVPKAAGLVRISSASAPGSQELVIVNFHLQMGAITP